MPPLIISALFFVLVYLSALAFRGMLKSARRPVDERFSALARQVQFAKSGGATPTLGRRLVAWIIRRVPTPDPESASAEKLGHELVHAGIPGADAVNRFYVARVLLAVAAGVAGVVFATIFGHSQMDIVVAAFSASSATVMGLHLYVKRRARLRQTAIASELSEAVDLLVVAVESGLGLAEAIQIVGTEAQRQHQVIGREFAIVSAEMSAGKTLGDALRSLADRNAVDDLKPLAATLIQSEQLGTQMGPALRASSDALRDARKLHAEEAAQKLSIKVLFPLVLLVLPAMLMLILGPAMLQILRTLSPK